MLINVGTYLQQHITIIVYFNLTALYKYFNILRELKKQAPFRSARENVKLIGKFVLSTCPWKLRVKNTTNKQEKGKAKKENVEHSNGVMNKVTVQCTR